MGRLSYKLPARCERQARPAVALLSFIQESVRAEVLQSSLTLATRGEKGFVPSLGGRQDAQGP